MMLERPIHRTASNASLSSLSQIASKDQARREIAKRMASVGDHIKMLQVDRTPSLQPGDSVSNVVAIKPPPKLLKPNIPKLKHGKRKQRSKSARSSWVSVASKFTNATTKSAVLNNATNINRTEIAMQVSVVVIPLAIIIALSALALYQAWEAKVQKVRMRDTILEALDVGHVLQLVIDEEDAICDYLLALKNDQGVLTTAEEYRQARVNTDKTLNHVADSWPQNRDAGFLVSLDEMKVAFAKARERAVNASTCHDAVKFYRAVDHPLTLAVVHHLGNTYGAKTCQYLTSFQSFIEAKAAFSTGIASGLTYFYGQNMSTAALAEHHEESGVANGLFDAAMVPVAEITFADDADEEDEWQIVFAKNYPREASQWKSLKAKITHQRPVNKTDKDTWRTATETLRDFLYEAEDKVHAHVAGLLRGEVNFQRTEMQVLISVIVFATVVCPTISVLYALFLRRQRMQIVRVAAKVRQQSKAITGEQRKTTQLLHQMLPKHVVDALRAGNVVVPESYQSVSVLFAEITGFSALVHSINPEQTVQILNAYYTSIDEVLEMHNCYKVEIVNDCVLISSGVPYRCGSRHSDELASAALDMLQAVTRQQLPHAPGEHLLMKIGLNTGPCSSGVLGSTKPKFCLFGDAVNTGSRMMSTSIPMCIQVSADAYTHLNTNATGQYVFEERGKRHVKGKGLLSTYWLLSKKDHPYTINVKDAQQTAENTTYFRKHDQKVQITKTFHV